MEWKDDGFKEHEEERDPVDVRISKTCEGIENKLLKQIYAMFDKERFIDLIMNLLYLIKASKSMPVQSVFWHQAYPAEAY